MKPVNKGIGRIWRCGTLVVALVVLVILAGTTGIMGADYYYTAHIKETDTRLDATPTGSPGWVRYDENGANLLVWGHEGPNDIRLLGRDLATRKVLDLPSSGFTVKGVEWCEGSDHIVVWGSPGDDLNDTLVFYESPSWSIGEGFLTADLIPLVEIDYIYSMASNIIFAVAGRDVNGTSRVLTMETVTKNITSDDPVQDDRTVVRIGTDGRFMFVLDDNGGLIVYSTKDWTIMLQMELLSTPFSSHFIERGNIEKVFGGQDGTVTTRVDIEREDWKTFSTGTGQVLGVWTYEKGDGPSYLVAATPEGESSSTLQIWDPMGGDDWSHHRNYKIDGRVSMMALDPTSNSTIVVAFQDGSVVMYELFMKSHEVDDTPSDWWMPYVWIASFAAIVLVVVYYLQTKRRGREDEKAILDDNPE